MAFRVRTRITIAIRGTHAHVDAVRRYARNLQRQSRLLFFLIKQQLQQTCSYYKYDDVLRDIT